MDFMLQAEHWRLENGLEKLDFSILSGPLEGFRNDCLPPKGGAERTKWLNNIVIPMCRLLPSCGEDAKLNIIDERPSIGRDKYLIGFYTVMESARRNLYVLRAPQEKVEEKKNKYGKYVTVTLRDTGWWVDRTTKVSEWVKVAKELKGQYRTVFIPDGTKPDTVIEGFDCDRESALNSFERAALYQGAVMNFGIPSGPMWMCLFQAAPLMMVKMVNENEPSTSLRTYEKVGLGIGKQMPRCRNNQRLVWDKEEAPIILREFSSMVL